jgi:hypothetical protein
MTSEPTAGKGLVPRVVGRLGSELDYAWAFTRGMLGRYPNDLCLRIFALRRSGHHAVMNWLRYQIPGRHGLLNDCRPGVNPFEGAQLDGSRVEGLFGAHKLIRTRLEAPGTFSYKGSLLYNFEDFDLRGLPATMTLDDERRWLGRSRRRMDVLILRDPFNLLASKLKWAYGEVERPSKPTLEGVVANRDLWKVHAQEYLGKTDFLSERVALSYNDWFRDREYRDRMAAELGFVNRDIGVEEVAKWGPSVTADSFDGLAFDGRAQAMKVLERWKRFENDTFYRDLVADPELHDLSQEIFGVIAGTEALRGPVS